MFNTKSPFRYQLSRLTPLLLGSVACSGVVDQPGDPNGAAPAQSGVFMGAPAQALPGDSALVPVGVDGSLPVGGVVVAPPGTDGVVPPPGPVAVPVGSDTTVPVAPVALPPVPPATQPGGTRITPTMDLDPGRVTLRRLNRAEYDNTVRDLLGTMLTPAQSGFPADDVEDGFDTIGDSLVVSLLLAEQLDAAATQLVDELLARPAGDAWRSRILVCEPTAADAAACNEQILTPFMTNAFRRPVVAEEVQQRVALATEVEQTTANVLEGLRAALKSVLLSPHFLFRVELGDPASDVATPLNDYELATRLSYFLWASMPDQQLMDAAAAQTLSAPDALAAQVDRMLSDPKAQGFFDNFAGQWLSTREAGAFVADTDLFPTFDEALRSAMGEETKRFFRALVEENQPLTALVVGDFSIVNERLAQHYELPGGQADFARVDLTGSQRVGILTQETFLTVTSYSYRTSPVRRADWVLEHLLCDPPPAAPAMVPAFVEPVVNSGLTLRQGFELHRADPMCASCHQIMDPIGFALENFDATGAYRTMDNGAAVDATGQMADGTPLTGVRDLAQAVAADADYAICLGKQVLTYAVGRTFSEPPGRAYAAGVGVSVKDGTWPDLVRAVVASQAFLTRRGETL